MLRAVQRVATFCNTPGNGLATFCKAVFFGCDEGEGRCVRLGSPLNGVLQRRANFHRLKQSIAVGR